MEDAQTIIVLLTIIAALLSIVILVLLGTVISLLIRINAIMKKIDKITMNVASATDWLSPAKVFSEITKLFRKK